MVHIVHRFMLMSCKSCKFWCAFFFTIGLFPMHYLLTNDKSKDLTTLCAGIGNLVNVILDAILVFPLGLGVRGAALATVTSEYVKSIIGFLSLFWILLVHPFPSA
jgi:Na+-driven multidrug efflux pump